MVQQRLLSELSSCVHDDKVIYHDEGVCPVCVSEVRRSKSATDLVAAIDDLELWTRSVHRDSTINCAGAWKRIHNLINRITRVTGVS